MIPEKILEQAAEFIRKGENDQAREILAEGLSAFPDHP